MLALLKRAMPLIDPVSRDLWAISQEADELQDEYKHRALEWVRGRIARARRTERAHLYKLHDELVRRMGPSPAVYRH